MRLDEDSLVLAIVGLVVAGATIGGCGSSSGPQGGGSGAASNSGGRGGSGGLSGGSGGGSGGSTTGGGGSGGGGDPCAPLSCDEIGECSVVPSGDTCVRTCAFYVNVILRSASDVEELASLGCHHVSPELEIVGGEISELSGLQSIKSLDGLVVDHTENLADLTSLSGLTELGGLVIQDTDQLETVALPSLTTLSNLRVLSNSSLRELDLPAAVGGDSVRINANPQLSELQLNSFQQLAELIVATNPALPSLEGFSSLTAVDSLRITNNDSLPQCEVEGFATLVGGCEECSNNDPTGVCN